MKIMRQKMIVVLINNPNPWQYAEQQARQELVLFQIFVNLKSNNIIKLRDNIEVIKERKKTFDANQKMPLKIYFNPDKYTAKEYFKSGKIKIEEFYIRYI